MSGAPDPTQGLGALSSAAQADVTSPPPSTSGPSSAAAIAAAAVLLQQQQQQQSSYAQGGLTSSPGGDGKNGSEEDARAMDEAFMRSLTVTPVPPGDYTEEENIFLVDQMTKHRAQLRGKFEGMVRTRNKIYQMIAAAMNRRFPNAQPKSTLEIKRRITCLVERVRRGGGDKYPPDHWHNVLTREYLNWHPTSVPSSIDGSPARGRTSTSRRRRSSRTTRDYNYDSESTSSAEHVLDGSWVDGRGHVSLEKLLDKKSELEIALKQAELVKVRLERELLAMDTKDALAGVPPGAAADDCGDAAAT
ncbi:hypothetical protein Pmar_PMAR007932 [Perkinsus marinus ATCC 50983]|uniref:Uncharacterized protein n=1 Tax=Perkinsus marinus (strain ATCC 50983 / TXsc) TaxID=423536 RepID=C5L4S0_PERM5|nr:hypothetical protein Pmar_PMAR007932 [Perkinsus marinus ATCC 50983]EER08261.1 hypothetical protein Pmar_PMAR007932 [Perkinsus marinus ATCC 50983]|eukprot:XP_002776445.1 hypothetical protein Pmar_PMAR007932 [Perkinsus marinus ATCC 50983]